MTAQPGAGVREGVCDGGTDRGTNSPQSDRVNAFSDRFFSPMIRIYNQITQGQQWLDRFRGCPPVFACVLGFTETGLIPGISAAGATPADRQWTAIADAEFLYAGPQPQPKYPLPPLQVGASPVLITRAVVANQQIPVHIFNAGLPHAPAIPAIDLGGSPARCVSTGKALALPVVQHLFKQGFVAGQQLAAQANSSYLILSECVVGGTTTALAVLTALGWEASGKVNSSHPTCNHQQKWSIVQAGLQRLAAQAAPLEIEPLGIRQGASKALRIVAAVGDPMQIVVAGMAIAASQTCGVLLAGGTQMLAVYALARSIAQSIAQRSEFTSEFTSDFVTDSVTDCAWQPEQIVVGTTRWVAEDPTGDTVGLAKLLAVPLVATQLNFATSRYAHLRAYEQGYVKEGVGAGGSAIAAHLYQNWGQTELLRAIESIAETHERFNH